MDLIHIDIVKILVSILCGSILGLEREYQNKSAGFRTIILICLGSTLFTMVSQKIGGTDDRVAANIITGIGFIGAGIIFKNNFAVTGLTTAAVIWISAAIGMTIGISEFQLAIALTIAVLFILSTFGRIEGLIDTINHRRNFTIVFLNTDLENLHKIEKLVLDKKLRSRRKQVSKKDGQLVVTIEIYGNKKRIKNLNEDLISIKEIEQI